MREYPLLALFRGIDPVLIKPKSFLFHVFVLQLNEDFSLPISMQPHDASSPTESKDGSSVDQELGVSYAGCGSVFGGKGNECANCRESEPINIIVDITSTLKILGLSRNQVKLVVVCEDEVGTFAMLTDLIANGIKLVEPLIVGPMFEQSENELKKDDKWAEMPEIQDVKQLQKWLQLHGYYSGTIDGLFGPMTEASVALFQKIAGIAEDGIPANAGVVDSATKRALVAPRNDHSKDVNVVDATTYESGTVVHYVVGWSPGYLDRHNVLTEVEKAINVWSAATGVQFTRVDRRKDMTGVVMVEWMDNSKEDVDALLRFDGPGGTLASATKHFIHLDASELWCTPHTPSKPNAFNIFSVVLHEMGHVLGLGHSSEADEVMSGWYNASHVVLTQKDMDRARLVCNTPFDLSSSEKVGEKEVGASEKKTTQ